MPEQDTQVEEIIARVAALGIGKAELVCCARVPHEGKRGRRVQDVETYSTMTRSLWGMAHHLRALGVSRVVMEALGGLEAGVLSYTPGVKESAGKKKGRGSTGHGNRYLARVLGEAAVTAGKTDTFLGERYRRIARRRGKKRAIAAVDRSMLVIIWHLLSDSEARYTDLGSDFYDKRINTERRKRTHIHQLEAMGFKVTIEPAA